jgi:hypothetical protein
VTNHDSLVVVQIKITPQFVDRVDDVFGPVGETKEDHMVK